MRCLFSLNPGSLSSWPIDRRDSVQVLGPDIKKLTASISCLCSYLKILPQFWEETQATLCVHRHSPHGKNWWATTWQPGDSLNLEVSSLVPVESVNAVWTCPHYPNYWLWAKQILFGISLTEFRGNLLCSKNSQNLACNCIICNRKKVLRDTYLLSSIFQMFLDTLRHF